MIAWHVKWREQTERYYSALHYILRCVSETMFGGAAAQYTYRCGPYIRPSSLFLAARLGEDASRAAPDDAKCRPRQAGWLAGPLAGLPSVINISRSVRAGRAGRLGLSRPSLAGGSKAEIQASRLLRRCGVSRVWLLARFGPVPQLCTDYSSCPSVGRRWWSAYDRSHGSASALLFHCEDFYAGVIVSRPPTTL